MGVWGAAVCGGLDGCVGGAGTLTPGQDPAPAKPPHMCPTPVLPSSRFVWETLEEVVTAKDKRCC